MRLRTIVPLVLCLAAGVATGTRVVAGPPAPPAASVAPLPEASVEYLVALASRLAKETDTLKTLLAREDLLRQKLAAVRAMRAKVAAELAGTTDPGKALPLRNQIDALDDAIKQVLADIDKLREKEREIGKRTAATRLETAAASFRLAEKFRAKEANTRIAAQTDEARAKADAAMQAATAALVAGIASGALQVQGLGGGVFVPPRGPSVGDPPLVDAGAVHK